MIDHLYERGPYGRCATCKKRKAGHTDLGEAWSPAGSLPETEPVPVRVVEPERDTGWLLLPVFFHLRRGLASRSGSEAIALDWPPAWPLPIAGQIVRTDTGAVGTVRSITFDLDRKRIVLDCD